MMHTKGPWIAKPEVAWSGRWNIDTEDEKSIASTWPGQLGADAALANARLIAAAPDLLEAARQAEIVLQRVVNGVVLESAAEYAQILLDSAIARATEADTP